MLKKFSSIIALAVIAAIVLAANLLGSLLFPRAKVDATEEKLYTLSQGSVNIASSIENDVAITFFCSKTAFADIPQLKTFTDRVSELLYEYEAVSGGKLTVETIDPRPDTEEEEAADLAGLQGVQAQGGAGKIFIGLLIRDKDTGAETAIRFLDPSRESTLEYEISKALSSIAAPEKKRVGVISSLPVLGGAPPMSMMMNPMAPPPQPQRAWAVMTVLRENFALEEIKSDATSLPSGLDLLVLLHPKKLDPALEYEIDQYVLGGGNALLFLDAMCEEDMQNVRQMSGGGNNMQMMISSSFHSIVPKPFSDWGVELVAGDSQSGFPSPQGETGPPPQIAADQNLAFEAPMRDGTIKEVFTYLRVLDENMNQESIITNELGVLFLPTPGALMEIADSDNLQVEVLMETTEDGSTVDGMMMKFSGNPIGLNDSYKPGASKLPLAYKITGKFKTAFPDGKPGEKPAEGDAAPENAQRKVAENESTIVVVADVDFLSDRHAVNVINFFGQERILDRPDNNNLAFLANSVENLTGSRDLISLRSRGKTRRPFTRVQKIKRAAQEEYREEEQRLQQKLQDANDSLNELKKQTNDREILTSGLMKERAKLQQERVVTLRNLRDLRRELREEVERLGNILTFVNIALIPFIVIALSLGISVFKTMHRRKAT